MYGLPYNKYSTHGYGKYLIYPQFELINNNFELNTNTDEIQRQLHLKVSRKFNLIMKVNKRKVAWRKSIAHIAYACDVNIY